MGFSFKRAANFKTIILYSLINLLIFTLVVKNPLKILILTLNNFDSTVQVFTHNPKTGWEQCGLSRNLYFSTKARYIIVDCPPNTYGDYVLIIKKGRGALGFREIHVRGKLA